MYVVRPQRQRQQPPVTDEVRLALMCGSEIRCAIRLEAQSLVSFELRA